jgi:hypothetical protein
MRQVVESLLRYHAVSDADAVGIREDFVERAAIYEYLGEFDRSGAELWAMHDVERTMKLVGTRPPRPPTPLRKAFAHHADKRRR